MPYRTSALTTRTRETVPPSTVLGLRFLALSFALAAAACALVMMLLGGDSGSAALRIGVAIPRVVAFAIPVGMVLVGVRAYGGSRVRHLVLGTAAIWIAALVVELFSERVTRTTFSCDGGVVDESVLYPLPAIVAIVIGRAVGLAGLVSIPFFVAPRRVIARWPFFAAGAVVVADTLDAARLAHARLFAPSFVPSVSSLLMLGLLGYGFRDLSRVLREESLDERADRLPPKFSRLFATPDRRAAFIGPVRLATDLVAALSVGTFAACAGPLAYGFSLRGHSPPTSVDACASFVGIAVALIWLRRRAVQGSLAPTIAAIAAAAAAILSTYAVSGPAGSAALFIVPASIIGLVVVAPRAQEGAARTMRRWVTTISAAGVLLGSAGFFALTETSTLSATSEGSGLARLAKLVAIGFAIAAANASTRLTLHARIELAAEQREP